MMSAELGSPGFLKIKVFRNKGYDIIIFDHGVTKKILSRDSNYILDVIMRPQLANSSISIRKVNMTSIL